MKELLQYANNSDIDNAMKITREDHNMISHILELKIPKRCITENAKHAIKKKKKIIKCLLTSSLKRTVYKFFVSLKFEMRNLQTT